TLARLLDVEDPPGGLKAINERAALAYFGTNGLFVHSWRHQGGAFEIVLEELSLHAINPCFQAVTWASRHLSGTKYFQVSLVDRSQPVIELSRRALDAT